MKLYYIYTKLFISRDWEIGMGLASCYHRNYKLPAGIYFIDAGKYYWVEGVHMGYEDYYY